MEARTSMHSPPSLKLMTDARETRTRNSQKKTHTRNLHEIEHALFDARNSREKYLVESQYDTRTSFSRELTRTSLSYEFLVRVSWALVFHSTTAEGWLFKCGRSTLNKREAHFSTLTLPCLFRHFPDVLLCLKFTI